MSQIQQLPQPMMDNTVIGTGAYIPPKKDFLNLIENPDCVFDIPAWLDPTGIQLFLDEPDSDVETSDTDSDMDSDESNDSLPSDSDMLTTDSEDLSSDSDLSLSDSSSIPEQYNESDFDSSLDEFLSSSTNSDATDDDMSVSSVEIEVKKKKKRKHKHKHKHKEKKVVFEPMQPQTEPIIKEVIKEKEE